MIPEQRRSDRELVIGKTGAGKSVWCRYHFDQVVSQKICIDVNNAEHFDGVKPVRGTPHKLNWKLPLLHYVPADPHNQDEYEALYRELFKRSQLTIWLDECYGPTTANAAPGSLQLVLTQGRKRELRHMAATQRPVHISRNLVAMADHIVIFPRGFSQHDLDWLGREMGVSRDEIDAAIRRALEPRMGEYGHVHYERRRHVLHVRPSIPPRARYAAHITEKSHVLRAKP